MTYTTTPLPDISGDYFLIIATFFLGLAVSSLSLALDNSENESWKPRIGGVTVIIIVASLLGLLGSVNYTRNIKPPLNEKVIATKVTEIEGSMTTSGKSSRTLPAMFVVYRTPDGEVQFRKSDGVIYPDQVILYKNPGGSL